MAKRSVNNAERQISPMFFIPEGMERQLSHPESYQYQQGDEEDSVDVEVTVVDSEPVLDDSEDYTPAPSTPDILGVISQTVRTSVGGTQVVDLVLEVDDVIGATKYEFRVTKI